MPEWHITSPLHGPQPQSYYGIVWYRADFQFWEIGPVRIYNSQIEIEAIILQMNGTFFFAHLMDLCAKSDGW